MYRIKCSNGLYVNKTYTGQYISYTKKGKVYMSENIAKKNIMLCRNYSLGQPNLGLTYELENIRYDT